MNKPRIIFMGTPTFGKEMLATLVENDYNVVAVVCQPDKVQGRKKTIVYCPVKQYALDKGIDVLQPISIKDEYQPVLDYNPDLIVTCAYGQFIPKQIRKAPYLGCINVHASLLPKLRGGAPIQHSIIDGYKETGITIMEMVAKMDAGDMLSSVSTEIRNEDTYRSLHDRLIPMASKLLLETMPSVVEHSYKAVKQDENEVTFGYNISKEEEHLDLSRGYFGVFNQIRGLIDEPCCYGIIDGKKLKFHGVELTDESNDAVDGTMVIKNKALFITVENRLLKLTKVQPEGKSAMNVSDYLNGAGRNINGALCQ